MFKLKKKVAALEKRIADLEVQVQSQQMVNIDEISSILSMQVDKWLKNYNEIMTKEGSTR